MSTPLNRREFLGTSALAGGMFLVGGVALRPLQAAEEAGWPKLPPVKVHVVYVGLGGAERKLRALLDAFRFTTVTDALPPVRVARAAAVARAS